jgi:hypothetical protein
MSTFDERQRNYENKFAHDEEIAFKMRARRDHLVGLWAAKRMHYAEDQLEVYADSLLNRSLCQSVNVLAELVQKDLSIQGVELELSDIRQEAERLLLTVKDQFMQEQREESQ